jgi:non-canonical (house-cleaning) NTP pyrophosphatase
LLRFLPKEHLAKEKDMRIVLGSISTQKLDALSIACDRMKMGSSTEIRGMDAPSGQNAQPVGFEETCAGAIARALQARMGHDGNVAIGIESGIFRHNGNGVIPVTVDLAVVVVITPDGRQIVTTSTGIQLPEACVEAAKKRGFTTTTVGMIMRERFGGNKADPHTTVTKGAISRKETLINAIMAALKQL